MQAEDAERFSLEADLRHALVRGELELEYQPLVDLSRGNVIGCEALAALAAPDPRHDRADGVHPDRRRSRRRSSRSTAGCCAKRAPPPRRSAHRPRLPHRGEPVGARSARARPGGDVGALLSEYDIAAHALIMEVTETAALDDDVLPGLSVCASSACTSRWTIRHRLQLARAPEAAADHDAQDRSHLHPRRDRGQFDRAIVVSIVNVAKAFGLRVVAEGIETDDQVAFVRVAGLRRRPGLPLRPAATLDALTEAARRRKRPRLRLVERTA